MLNQPDPPILCGLALKRFALLDVRERELLVLVEFSERLHPGIRGHHYRVARGRVTVTRQLIVSVDRLRRLCPLN